MNNPVQTPLIVSGNANLDSTDTRGWLIGNFIPESEGLRHTDDIELKWGEHLAGDAREEWTTSEVRTTIGILISGQFVMEFRNQTVKLSKPGDYVMWGPDTHHKWHVPENCIFLTVRWQPQTNKVPDSQQAVRS